MESNENKNTEKIESAQDVEGADPFADVLAEASASEPPSENIGADKTKDAQEVPAQETRESSPTDTSSALDSRLLAFEDRLRSVESLSERIQSCESNLTALKESLTESLASLRDECARLISPDSLLAPDGPLMTDLSEKVKASSNDLSDKLSAMASRIGTLEETLAAQAPPTRESIESLIEDKVAEMAKKVASEVVEKHVAPLEAAVTRDAEEFRSLIDEKIAAIPAGISSEELDARLAPILAANDVNSTKLETSIEAVTNQIQDLRKETGPSLDTISTMLDEKMASIPSGVTEVDLESRMNHVFQVIDEKLACAMPEGITKDDLEARLSAILTATETMQTTLEGRIDAIQDQMQALAAQKSAPALDALKDSLMASLKESLQAMLDEKLAQIPLGITKEDLEVRLADVLAANEATRNEVTDRLEQLKDLTGLRESLEGTLRSMLDEQVSQAGLSFEDLESHLAPIREAVGALTDQSAREAKESIESIDSLLDTKLAALPLLTREDLEARLREIASANETWQKSVLEKLHGISEKTMPDMAEFKEALQASLLAKLTLAFKPLLDEQIAQIPRGLDRKELDERISPLEDAISGLTGLIAHTDIDALLDQKLANLPSGLSEADLDLRLRPLVDKAEENRDELARRIDALHAKLQEIAALADASDLAALQDSLETMLTQKLESLGSGVTSEELDARLAPIQAALADLPKEAAMPAKDMRELFEERITPILNATEQSQADFVTLFNALNEKIQELAKAQPTVEDIERFLAEKISGKESPTELTDRLEALQERMTVMAGQQSSIEALTSTLKESTVRNAECFAAVEQKIDTLFGDLSASEGRIRQNLEKRQQEESSAVHKALAGVQREREIFTARVDSLEKRIDALEPTFNARIDKAAAGATARILREELRQILG